MALSLSKSDKIVGKYRLLGELGQGGTATVFLAVASGPRGFNKLVVLKKMKPQFATEPGFTEMFMTEARLAARLNHPNIVQTYEVLEHDGLPVIVMEYLEGKSLADITALCDDDCPFTLQHYLTAISEALSGLHHSHELTDYKGRPMDLVHRDVTPHNVLVTYEGQVKILDFGIAKLRNSTVETETGIVKGKLRYIPPEQIVGERVDRRSDIYSVGVMLWEAAVGEKMWRGLGDAAVMNRVLNEEIPSPREKNPDVPRALDQLIMKALAPDPANRQQTAKELQRELDAVRQQMKDPVTPRDLAPAMEALFDSDRSKTRRLIQQRIVESTGVSDSTAPPRISTIHARTPAREGNVAAWLLTVSGILGVGATVWALNRTETPADMGERADQAVASNAGETASHEESATRRVRLTAFPQSARIFVDGVAVDGNPSTSIMRADAKTHRVRVTAEGFYPLEQEFELDRDVDAVFRLRPVPPPAKTEEPEEEPTPSAPRRTARSPAPPPVTPDCSPPYVIDDRGIKRFKVECMQ